MIFKRIFGKKTAIAERPDVASKVPARKRKYGADIEIDMKEVAGYAEAMARHRGYGDDASRMIARRVVFLERRNLPGLAALHREVSLYNGQTIESRFIFHGPNGAIGGHCPFYAGVALEPSLDMLTAVTPEDRRWAPAPSNPLLLVPKLAEWLRPTGRRTVFWWEKDKDVPGFIVVEGYRLHCFRKFGASDAMDTLQHADHIGFSDCPADFEPTPEPRSGFRETISIKPRDLRLIEDYLRS